MIRGGRGDRRKKMLPDNAGEVRYWAETVYCQTPFRLSECYWMADLAIQFRITPEMLVKVYEYRANETHPVSMDELMAQLIENCNTYGPEETGERIDYLFPYEDLCDN